MGVHGLLNGSNVLQSHRHLTGSMSTQAGLFRGAGQIGGVAPGHIGGGQQVPIFHEAAAYC